jgi:hypothetical protein
MDAILRVLGAMGSTPDQVAATLRTAGVRGFRESTSFMNPVVRYLKRNLEIDGRLEALTEGNVVRLTCGETVQEAPLPVPVRDFLEGFHRGSYPDLEGV